MIVGASTNEMAERQHRHRLRALRNDRNLARFVVEGRATGKQLGTDSYGSVAGADPAIQEGRVKGHCTLLKWVWSMGVATDLQTLL